jgi:hypothetical protein
MRDGVMVTCIVCPFRSNMRPTMIATAATCWTRKCATKAVTSARRFSSTADSVSTGATCGEQTATNVLCRRFSPKYAY